MLNASVETSGPEQWAEHEFGKAKLNDRRLVRRLKHIAANFAAQPSVSIPKSSGTWAQTKGAYRFFAHADLQSATLLEPHQERTRERCLKQSVVLVVQDTTGLHYGPREGTGLLGSVMVPHGLWLHTSMAFTPAGQPLGIIQVESWARELADHGKAALRYERAIEDKESQRWLNSFKGCVQWAGKSEGTRWVNIADREADIYDLFVLAAAHPEVGVLVRSQHNRKTAEGSDVDSVLKALPAAGQIEIQVPRKPGRPSRRALLEVRFARIQTRAPKRSKAQSLELWVVEAREIQNKGTPIHWRLFTNLPVENLEEAIEKIEWYRVRWQIEEYHRVLKSGCAAEGRQLETATRLTSVLMVDMVVAWRVLSLSRRAREHPEEPVENYFAAPEIKVIQQYRQNYLAKKVGPLTLLEAVRTVAQMGGFLGRKSDGQPGAMTLWRGLERLSSLVQGWQLAQIYG